MEVDDPSAVVGEHDEHEEEAEASGGHGEDVDGDQVADMVGGERPPGLRGAGGSPGHEPGNGALGDVDTELQELSVDAGRTPQRIRCGHLSDEGSKLSIDGRAASGGPGGQLG